MKYSRKRHRKGEKKRKAAIMLEPPGPLRFMTQPLVPEPADAEDVRCEEGAAATQQPAGSTPWKPKWMRWGIVGAIVTVATLGVSLYVHTLDFPFQFDDHVYLVGSPFVTEMKELVFHHSFKEVANHSAALGLGYDPSVNFILRPVAYLGFHLNYLLSGGFTPASFRAVNIAIHCTNAVLLFLLLTHLLRKSPRAANLPDGSALFIPLAGSLLFVAHPLHTESVTYIVQRFTSMVGMFLLTAMLLHFYSLTAKRKWAVLALRTGAVGAMIAGMLTKESSFTGPLLIVMLHIVVMGGTVRKACWQALPHLLCMLIIPVLALMVAHAQAGNGGIAAAMQIAASSKDPAYQWHYFLTQLGVILEYVRLIVWPQGMNVDRQYQLATSIMQLRVWLSGLVIMGIIVSAWRHYRSHKHDVRHVLISAGIFWFFLRLAVSSSFVPLDDLMVDHRTYGASMGLLTVLACLLDLLRTEAPKVTWVRGGVAAGMRWAAPVILMAWIGLLSMKTFSRNEVWQSETNLWSDAVMKSPNKARPWDNLGVCHFMAGRQDEAIACLVKSVSLNPRHLPAYMKLGVIYNSKTRFGEAIDWSQKGLALFPDAAALHYNLGVAFCGIGRIPDGLSAMQHAVQYMPTHAAAHAALGQIYRHMGKLPQSLQHYRQAASLGAGDSVVMTAITELEMQTAPRHVLN